VRIDFEGTAKGLVADRSAQDLGAAGPALVDAGGKIAVSGSMLDGSPWPIGVANPRDPGKDLAVLRISSGGVATSAVPAPAQAEVQTGSAGTRSGEPWSDGLLSVTVVGQSALAAEVAARAVLLMGSEKGMEWLQARPQLACLMVLEDGTTLQTPNFAEINWS
jgi:thiamine biosynthesis lipoprotein